MNLLLLQGDGIGPEIAKATQTVLEAVSASHQVGLRVDPRPIGLASLSRAGSTFPNSVLDEARAADGIVLAPVDTYAYPAGQPNPSATLRKVLDLFANIRPARRRLPTQQGENPIDLVIFRENTEGFYADRNMAVGSGEFRPTDDLTLSIRRITRGACARIARAAFAEATRRRGHVTAVHKANVLKLGDGMFLEEVERVAADYPEIKLETVIVDAMAALLVRHPFQFDVVVTTNMYGDILSDLTGELAGGLGLAPSINAGDRVAIAQAVHGSAPDIAGRGIANPVALILSAAMLLDWLAKRHDRPDLSVAAAAVEDAVDAVLANPDTRTADLGGPLSTQAFADAVSAHLA